jgi:hypothetical protein
MYDTGQYHVDADWSALVVATNRPMQVRTPKRLKSRPVDQAIPAVVSVLKMWVNGVRGGRGG